MGQERFTEAGCTDKSGKILPHLFLSFIFFSLCNLKEERVEQGLITIEQNCKTPFQYVFCF